MSVKVSIVFFLLTVTTMSSAQKSFNSDQLREFVDCYLTSAPQSDIEITLQRVLKKHNVPASRYGEIIRSRIGNKDIVLSSNEKLCLEEIKVISRQNKSRSLTCEFHYLNEQQYLQIRTKYKNDIHFQQSLKPYFDNYIKNRK